MHTIKRYGLTAVCLLAFTYLSSVHAAAAMDGVAAVHNRYERWRSTYENQGGSATHLVLPLAWSFALSTQKTSAHGRVNLDLLTGQLNAQINGLDQADYSLWLIDNQDQPGNTVRPEPMDHRVYLGNLNNGTLSAQLTRDDLRDFKLDLVVLTPANQTPEQAVLLVGAPDLMSRLYYSDKLWPIAKIGTDTPIKSADLPFGFLLPKPANAAAQEVALVDSIATEIEQGRQLFNNETFNGNGRTCATCHRPDNNYTLDPNYIAKLPAKDPLFVAETNPQLKDLEKPKLLRQFGLILANVDGLDKPGVLRSVPPTLALTTSIDVELSKEHGGKGEFPQDERFAHALGWSGDGSPGMGSLREFAMGAIVQHSPKTLTRTPDVDFRLPTDAELDALEAFMLSLGRGKDFDLGKLSFKSEVAERGKALFNTKENPCQSGAKQPCAAGDPVVLGKTANCNGCHMNAGARSSTTFANPTRDTGIENMADQPARLVDNRLAVDGGFGRSGNQPDEPGPRGDCGPEHNQLCYGEGRFNTPALIEAADTAPYFHNNSVSTLEEAIASYNGDAFNQSPGAKTSSGNNRQVKLESTQVVAVATFLRQLNVLENLLNSNRLDASAQNQDGSMARESVRLAMADTSHALDVVKEGRLQTPRGLLNKLEAALMLEKTAQYSPALVRNPLLQAAIQRKKEAQALLVQCDPQGIGADTDPQRVYSCEELDQYENL